MKFVFRKSWRSVDEKLQQVELELLQSTVFPANLISFCVGQTKCASGCV